MSDQAIEQGRMAQLRSRAAARLSGGAAGKGSPSAMADALSALYTLASSPRTAPDALALLHELQVHQVELDLQAQELVESRAEMESALRRQVDLYDSQPVGCFTIDAGLAVQGLNRTGAIMLGVEDGDGHGVNLGDHLSTGSRHLLAELVARAFEGTSPGSCVLQLCRVGEPERTVRANLRVRSGAGACLVVLADASGQ